jgi:hypothetical protein
MDRARALARLNRRLLERFSARVVSGLRGALPLRLALPRFETFLARNLDKEIRKDGLVVQCARDALAAGAQPGADEVRALLAAARAIDREFLGSVASFPVRLTLPYARIEPVRQRRIERGLALAARILDAWGRRRRVGEVMTRAELAREMDAILRLYCEEAAALADGVRLPPLVAPLRDRLAATLLRLMQAAAARTAADIAAQKRR